MSQHHFSGSAKGAGASSNKVGASSLNEEGWERSDFPILCETCLGPNPYLRMTKAQYDKECKVCARPFTVFRWRPGKDARHKKTEVCQTCAKLKNVCQTCLLDLQYNLPVQVRDQELAEAVRIEMPESGAHKEWFAEQAERRLTEMNDLPYGKVAPTETLLRLQRTTPYYKRNQARICSFFVKGTCNRGDICPYRHEMPLGGELSNQNMKDRYYGVNDPVANKMLRGASEKEADMTPPSDPTITTLYVGGVVDSITEADLRSVFYPHGEIASIRIIQKSKIAFVDYQERASAEQAAHKLNGKLVVKGERLRLMWGKSQGQGHDASSSSSTNAAPTVAMPSVVGQMPMMPSMPQFPAGGAAPGFAPMAYPSMNPTAMGARPQRD